MEENKLQPYQPPTKDKYRSIIEMVIDALPSENSRRAYQRHLEVFFDWHHDQGQPELNKALISSYLKYLREEEKLSSANINQRLSAIKRLVSEAEDNSLIEQQVANGIRKLKGVKRSGERLGNWLTNEEAALWLNAPDLSTVKGIRDRALLGVMLGAGLRRSEVANLQFSNLQMRKNRWVIVNIVGKGNKTRSVPIKEALKNSIYEWAAVAKINSGNVFRPVHRSNQATGSSMTPQAIYKIIKFYAVKLAGNDIDKDDKAKIAPHDLRRTFAHLAFDGGTRIDQLQLTLGHESILTTEKYLGSRQNLEDAPADYVDLPFY